MEKPEGFELPMVVWRFSIFVGKEQIRDCSNIATYFDEHYSRESEVHGVMETYKLYRISIRWTTGLAFS
jgi:hypothetical protein